MKAVIAALALLLSVSASAQLRFSPLIMGAPLADDPGCPPLSASRGDDATWFVICSTRVRQFNGSFLVVQTPTSVGAFDPNGLRDSSGKPIQRFASMTINAGWLDYTYPFQSSDMEFLGTCKGANWDALGHHCGFFYEGTDNSLFLGFQDGNLGRPDIPFGTVWTKIIAVPYHRCSDGSECMPIMFGGLTRYVKVYAQ